MRRRGLQQLVGGIAGAGGHEIDELACVPSERRPVEIVVGDQALMDVAAAAVEAHAVDGGMRRARQPFEQPEGREGHVGLLSPWAREGVPGCERVVHRPHAYRPAGRPASHPFCG